jgi:xylan 1,4-beta-xylosidase
MKKYYPLNKIHVILSMILLIDISHLKSQEQDNIKELDTAFRASAYFDYFTYKGEDQYYAENPLPDEDCFYNPVLPGWYSDPSICSNGEDYFLVTSTFIYYPGVPIFHSSDLVNWKQIGHVLDRPSQLINLEGQHTSGGIFAPAISYNPHNKTYYMITTNVGAGNFFVKTKDPFGSWSDPVWVRNVKGIDPSFFFDDDGKAYILNNDEPEGPALYDGHRAIRIREFDLESEKIVGTEKVLVNGGVRPEEKPIWIEGPHMYKINGQYYLMAAEGGTGPGHSEVILKGDSPMGEFKPWVKNPILTQRHLDPKRENPVTCAGHADLIRTKEGTWWSFFLACRPIEGKFENLGRETFLMPSGGVKKDFRI